MNKILKRTWRIIRKNFGSLLLFETGYRIASFWLIMRVVKKALDFSLRQQNISYLTAENYLKILSHPWSIALGILILLLILLLFLIEVSALLSGFYHSGQNRKVYASDLLFEGIRRTFFLLRYSRGAWIFCAALAAPFLTVWFLVREISYVRVLEFTARQIYQMVKPHWVLYLLLAAVLLISFLFVFALPYCILEKKKSWRGIREGIFLLRKRKKQLFGGVLLIQMLQFLLTVLAYGAAFAVMVGITKAVRPADTQITTVLIWGGYLDMGIGVFAGAVQLVLNLAFVYAVYAGFHKQEKEEIQLYALMKNYAWFSRIGRRKAAAVLTLLLVLCESAYLTAAAVSNDNVVDSLNPQTKITAHRGGALKAPENTISALSYTIECGAEYAEIDVQETKDGELILLHDNSYKRTAGVNKKVWEMDYAQVAKLDAGASFHERFRGEKIPTLDDVLNFCSGSLDLNIEIKYNGKNKGIVNKVARTIREHDFAQHCVVTSMNYQFLRQLKKIAPEIRTGYIMTMAYGSISDAEAADFFSVKYTYITEDFVREAHSLGKEVHAWTVNYRGDAKRMLDMGVDNLITDDPIMVREVQNQESGNTDTGFFELMKYSLRI